MKLTLKLNEEQQGLKLIQVNDGFVVVGLRANLRTNDYFIHLEHLGISKVVESFEKWLVSNATEQSVLVKIIFATPNLNLEGVPVIEEKDLESNIIPIAENLLKSHSDFKAEGMSDYQNGRFNGIIEGYKQAQQNLFTEEQVIEYGKELLKTQKGESRLFPEAILYKIKQPTVEITFENNKPFKCIML